MKPLQKMPGKLSSLALLLFCTSFFIPGLLHAQGTVRLNTTSSDNCMSPTPNAGDYTPSGTMNGKTQYVKGSFLRIIWTGSTWAVQGDDPQISGVNWVTGWHNDLNTSKPPSDCWVANFGCFPITMSGDVALSATLQSISRTDASPNGSQIVNYTVTFSQSVNNLGASNFTVNSVGAVSGAFISAVTKGAGNTWNVAVNTGTGNGQVGITMVNANGLSHVLCSTLPYTASRYAINKAACSNPTVPTVTANHTVNCGTVSTTLSIVSGTLNSATTWQWYSGSCGGTAVGTGTSINVSPSGTTTYYVRGIGGCVTPGTCASITITVNTPVNWYLDADGDGYYTSGPVQACSSPGAGYTTSVIGAGDCAPADPTRHASFNFYPDSDGDGYGAGSTVSLCAVNANTPPAGYSTNNTDCAPADPTKHASFNFYADTDGDGYGAGNLVSVCAVNATTPPAGYSLNNTDCAPTDPTKHASFNFYADTDGDGYGAGNLVSVCAVNATTPPAGYSLNNTDCAPTDPTKHASFNFYADTDGDGYGAGNLVSVCAVDASTPPAGYSLNNTDCAPNDPTKHASFNFYVDNDGDGYGTGSPVSVCAVNATTPPAGYALIGGDCMDSNPDVHPGATEICDGIDNDCNGQTDDIVIPTGAITGATTAYIGIPEAYSVPATAGSSYSWNFTNGTQNTGGSTANVTGTFNSAGTQTVSVTETIAGGCVGTAVTLQVNVIDPCVSAGSRLYVKASAAPGGNGGAWSCAMKELRDAVAYANTHTNIKQIWVAAGTYKPTATTNRAISMAINRADLKIMGGFSGVETDASQANPLLNPTIVSGDIGIPSLPTDNSYHLFYIQNVPLNANPLVFSGLVMTGGFANAAGGGNNLGAVAILYNINPGTAVQFNQCAFTQNFATRGGALYLNYASAGFEECIFALNAATGDGGAIFAFNSSNHFNRTQFGNNTAGGAGGAYYSNYGSSECRNTVFSGNTAASSYGGGAVYQNTANCNYYGCVFSGNSATMGGGIYQHNGSLSQIINTTFFNNAASNSGGAVVLGYNNSTSTIQNSIFWKNTRAGANNVANADIWNIYSAAGNVFQNNILQANTAVPADNGSNIANNMRNVDPMFVNESNPGGVDILFGTADDGLQLQAGSPAINAGLNAAATGAGLTVDLLNNARISCNVVDLGGYEVPVCNSPARTPLYSSAKTIEQHTDVLSGVVMNPFSNELQIRYTGTEKCNAVIYGDAGKRIWNTGSIAPGITRVNTSAWTRGLYQVVLKTSNGKQMVFKAIKL